LPDHIDHPVHYTQGIECIDYIQSHKMNYLEGNIIKYVTRYKFKGGVDDLRKAEWYLKKLMQSIAVPKNDWNVDCAKPLTMEDPVADFMKDMELERKLEWARESNEALKECHKDYCDNYIKPHFPSVKF